MKMHKPTDEEQAEVEACAAIVTEAILYGDRGPGFAGAVLTISMSHILSLLDDDMAEACIVMHSRNAMELSRITRARLEGMTH